MDNKWINYISRSYEQIKKDVLSKVKSLAPEITDHNESNLFIKMLDIWAAISEMLGYYIDNVAREGHLITTRLFSTMTKHAFANDYPIHGKLAATTNLRFYIEETSGFAVSIPVGTVVSTDDDIVFYTTESATIAIGEIDVYVGARQGVPSIDNPVGTAAGLANETMIIPASNIASKSLVVKVDGVAWTSVETLAFSSTTDTHYISTVNADKEHIIRFGDGFNGAIPEVGLTVTANYDTIVGVAGNVSADTLINIVSSVPVPSGVTLAVSNPERASGGSDVESVESIRYRIPRVRRTLGRAVTRQDYIDIMEIMDGVAKAGVYFDCGKSIDLYIVPEGGGIASSVLIDEATLHIEDKRIIGTAVNILSAGEVRVKLDISGRVLPQFQKLAVGADLKSRLTDFLSYRFQSIQGEVQLSDIYEIIENTAGIDYSKVIAMTSTPYATYKGDGNKVLLWDREVKEGSDEPKFWKVQMLSATTFQLFRSNTFLGVFTVGAVINTDELTVTINDNGYVLGDEWRFNTYPYFGTLKLQEPSIPISLEEDITLTLEGGI